MTVALRDPELGDAGVPLACKLPALCRLLSLTWEYGFPLSDSIAPSRMSLWSTIVVSIQAHGSGGRRSSLALPGPIRVGLCPWFVAGPTQRHIDETVRMEVVAIRAARLEDSPDIAVVHVRSWQSAYRGLLPQAYLDSLDPAQRIGRWERSLSETNWSHDGILVADANGCLLGFVSYGPARDDDADSKRVGEIHAIYLVPAAWDKGIGKQLMAAALERLVKAGFNQATLWVLDSNVRARHFYEAGGWPADGAVKRDESRGFLLIEMRYRRSLTFSQQGRAGQT